MFNPIRPSLLQLYTPGWIASFNGIVESMLELFGEENTRKALYVAGAKIAGHFQIDNNVTFDGLEDELNRQLDFLRWGSVEVTRIGGDVRLKHTAFPAMVCASEPHVEYASVFLGGVYYQWFSALGMDPAAEVSVLVDETNGLIADIRFL
jgi:hypothetical protein